MFHFPKLHVYLERQQESEEELVLFLVFLLRTMWVGFDLVTKLSKSPRKCLREI